MAIALPVGPQRTTAENCPGATGHGWQVCIGHHAVGCVGVLPGPDLLRVVVAEPLSDTCPRGLRERLAALTRELLEAGVGPTESADRLVRRADAGRRTAPQAGLTVLDLRADGQVQVACRYAPSAVHTTAGRMTMLPALPGTGEATARLATGDHLLAYSGTFLEAVPPGMLAGVPDRRPRFGSCALWHTLTAGLGPDAPAPDLAVITRC